ncbi:conserved hypothetical protein [Methylobacterium nodulans ORS 2060]|uniref:Hemerythrin-like domain-containing protein n=2 Tax=Methylobacterium nodulans TaxID=114616 RepID=B8IHI6_METNO|nr:conserved hypothetical protein [Methylobacterium nodulans ORS 2060]
MNVWQLIARDHANIAELIREIPNALNGPGVIRSRERLLADLIDELRAHSEAVEASLFEPLSAHGRAGELIDDLRHEHGQVMRQLSQLSSHHRKGSEGWLNTFEDATYLVDQHLYRHRHDLLPMAREALPSEEVRTATTAFVRAKVRALQASGPRSLPQRVAIDTTDLFGALAVGLTAAALLLIVWRSGRPWGGAGDARSRARTGSPDGISRGRSRADQAAASAPGNRVPGEDLNRRQDKLLDEALEETFPSSDPISPHQITR